MARFNWAETFISLEGEFLYQGYPTVYVRFSRCNFTCQKFNNPDNIPITNDVLGFNPKDYNNLKDIPLITMGCDSLYAHDDRFSHLWKSGNEHELAAELTALLPHVTNTMPHELDQLLDSDRWIHPITGHPYILSLTGGEPTLYQKIIPELLQHPLLNDLRLLLIETNASVPLRDEFIEQLNSWLRQDYQRKIIWSNSPKLSASGEDWSKAIRPEIVKKQLEVIGGLERNRCIQYFKFVVGPRSEDFEEVEKAMEVYATTIGYNTIVGVMPECCTAAQQVEIGKQVADMCIKRGYVYVSRLQNYLWGNEVGT